MIEDRDQILPWKILLKAAAAFAVVIAIFLNVFYHVRPDAFFSYRALGVLADMVGADTVVVKAGEGIEKGKLRIFWACDYIDESNNVLVYEGRQTSDVGGCYGVNDFRVVYSGDEVYKGGHFKTNNWHRDLYIFSVMNTAHGIRASLAINGPDNDVQAYEEYR
jgi:hypothetical protein